MAGEITVGDCNSSRAHYRINKSIRTVGQRAMVHPDMARTKDGNCIPISHGSPSIMGRRTANHSISSGFAVMDVEPMDDDIGDILDGNTGSVGNVDISATSINCLEAVHDKLLLKCDHHVLLKSDPEGFILDDCVSKCSWQWIHRIIIARVCHNIEISIPATNGISTKANPTISKSFPIVVPVRITPPAVINWVACAT